MTKRCEDNVVLVKSKAFALRMVKLYRHLSGVKNEFVLSKQALRSGTSIGANAREASQAQSRADFISKMAIALKEAYETEYWLELLTESGLLTKHQGESVQADLTELLKLLTSIVKTARTTP